ncbi:hypothetical protein [Actibacterium sp. MT2.3-13A]|uniref:hypothetical protein n=1 Tax=Actibacterium sp. MT2.3-13A TaxID=2828332 RepID=UPI001BA6B052|nr:hypothetical protein [Actibacterium sp. MT2.3-13A]
MNASVFVFGTDLVHEGTPEVLDALQDRAGATDVVFSATYHDARDVFPHNPRYRVYRHEGDIAWFHARRDLYDAGFAPKLAEAAEGVDVLDGLCGAARERGMTVSAWTIFLHNSRLAAAQPDCATRNVYGDAYLSDLCPANPDVRRYCRALAGDIARYPVDRLLAESLHYRTLEHGEHHERYLIALPGWARALMSLCFCPHCRAVGERAGVNTDSLADHIRHALAPVWQGQPPVTPALSESAAEALARFGQARRAVVTSLVAEVKAALEPSGVALSFIDHGGAMAHVLPGVSAEDDLIAVAGDLLGIDPAAVAAECDEYVVLGYTGSPERLAAQLRRYREALGADTRLAVALRPLAVDCDGPDNLRAKVGVARAAGAASLAFYHYAMMPLDRLDWIGSALAKGE